MAKFKIGDYVRLTDIIHFGMGAHYGPNDICRVLSLHPHTATRNPYYIVEFKDDIKSVTEKYLVFDKTMNSKVMRAIRND